MLRNPLFVVYSPCIAQESEGEAAAARHDLQISIGRNLTNLLLSCRLETKCPNANPNANPNPNAPWVVSPIVQVCIPTIRVPSEPFRKAGLPCIFAMFAS